ncbi:MAG TPA: hypothetical protein DGG94_19395 [Micromonosporaceae bacterium]|nr:hypothetical protein [Micromonosporaceae bacterium]HCU51934.1 hypothetical protein [Micromonosporaceae bacterium]
MIFDGERDQPLLRHMRDPVLDRFLRKSLEEQAANDPDPLRRDMARDVLSGAITLQQAANSNVYGELFARQADELADWWDSLSEKDRDRLYAEAVEAIADLDETSR